jgi:hypothetical protein
VVSTVVKFAQEVLDMDFELQCLRAEVQELREYRKKYIDLLDESVSHGKHMLGSLLDLTLKPGVMDAITAANQKELS